MMADIVHIFYSVTEDNQFKETAEALHSALSGMSYRCNIEPVKSFDFQAIVDAIYKTCEDYRNECGDGTVTISVDITIGTNLMTAAACNTAFFTNARIFYMMDQRRFPDKSPSELLMEIPSPKIPDVRGMSDQAKNILRFISSEREKGHQVTMSDISHEFDIKLPSVKYHIGKLEAAELIEEVQARTSSGRADKRARAVDLTRQGRMVVKWIRLSYDL